MNITVQSLHNCAVYLDGVGYVGRAAELEMPHVKKKMIDHNGLGMAFDLELPAGVDKLESAIKWASYDQAAIEATQDNAVHQILTMGNLEVFTAQGLSAQLPIVYRASGIFKDGGKAAFKKQQMVEISSMMTVYHSELYVAGVQIHLIDVFSNQWIVGGNDQLSQFRNNLGG